MTNSLIAVRVSGSNPRATARNVAVKRRLGICGTVTSAVRPGCRKAPKASGTLTNRRIRLTSATVNRLVAWSRVLSVPSLLTYSPTLILRCVTTPS